MTGLLELLGLLDDISKRKIEMTQSDQRLIISCSTNTKIQKDRNIR